MPTVYEQILLRRGTSLEWAAANPVLGAAEIGVETDTGRFKLGDGTTTWNLLAYKSDRGLPGVAGPAGPQGEAGPAGPAGPKGPSGSSAMLSIGSVSQGTSPSATITGTAEAPVLNLVLPKGDTGSAGAATAITIGTVTSGTTPSATFSGTAPNLTLNLVLPKGETGSTGPAGAQGVAGPTGPAGPQGDKGAAAVIKGVITTWPPASSPSLGDLWILGTTIPSGTPSAGATGDGFLYVGGSTTSTLQANGWLDIGQLRGPAGPQGATGATGAQGPTGAAGAQGIQGVAGSQGPAGPTPTLTIGTVTTGAVASASITGTAPNFVLNLVLPSAAANQQSTVFTLNPADTSVNSGATVTFTALAQSTESPIVYSWQKMASGASTWSTISGATSTTYSTSVLVADNGTKFRCSATTATVGTVYSQIATLTVGSAPVVNGSSWKLGSGTVDYPWNTSGYSRIGAVRYADTSDISGGMFATGYSYSVDGVAWQTCPAPVPATSRFNRICRGNGIFFAVSDCWVSGRQAMATLASINGTNWGAYSPVWASTPGFSEAQSYDFGVNRFLITAKPSESGSGWSGAISSPSGTLWQCLDGRNITALSTNVGSVWNSAEIRYSGTRWFAWLTDGYFYSSSDGATWAKTQLSGVDFYYGSAQAPQFDIAYNGSNLWVMIPKGGNTAYTSSNGTSWTARSIGTTADWRGVTYGNGLFMALSSMSTCITSSDGITWTVRSTMPLQSGITPAWTGLAYGANVFVAAGAQASTGRYTAVTNLCYTG